MHAMFRPMKFENFIIDSVDTEDEQTVEFKSKNGQTLRIDVYGDCCDYSYFDKDSLEDIKLLVGQDLVSIEDVETNAPETDAHPDAGEHNDSQHVHCLVVKTRSSEISVLWRNDSNGCYRGQIEMELKSNEE